MNFAFHILHPLSRSVRNMYFSLASQIAQNLSANDRLPYSRLI